MTSGPPRRHAAGRTPTGLSWRLGLTVAWLGNGGASLALAVASRQVNATDLGGLSWLIPFLASVFASGFALAGTRRYLGVSAAACAVWIGYGVASWWSPSFVGARYLIALAAGSVVATLAVFLTVRK